MKTLQLWLLATLLVFVLASPAQAQQAAAAPVTNAGAPSVKDLALLLHGALQNANFAPLTYYIPSKQVYDRMLQQSTAPVREQLLLYPPDQMLFDLQRDFAQVLQDGLLQEVNWPETKIKSISVSLASPEGAAVVPVQLMLTTKDRLPLQINFNAARLDSSFYYLEPIRVQSADFGPKR